MKLRMLTSSYRALTFHFGIAAATSKADLIERISWFVLISDGERIGIGECAPMPGYSIEWGPDYERKLASVCESINSRRVDELSLDDIESELKLSQVPSIVFGLECALRDLQFGGQRKIFANGFFEGERALPINGLIWMGTEAAMWKQIEEKVRAGFSCIKIKVGSRLMTFDNELKLLKRLRSEWSESELKIRLDANGAWSAKDALEKLSRLSEFSIESIEQPLAVSDPFLSELCQSSSIPIALDEELTVLLQDDLSTSEHKRAFLKEIRPSAIVLKPSLIGGLAQCREWISAARSLGIDWWITSFLESNIGLNSIAQFTAELSEIDMIHGLGTGGIYSNNIASPLVVQNGFLKYDPSKSWDCSDLI